MGQIVLGLEVAEADVPEECAERLDRVDLVVLRAEETQPQILVRTGGKPRLAVGNVVITGVGERDEPRIALRASLAFEGPLDAPQRFGGPRSAGRFRSTRRCWPRASPGANANESSGSRRSALDEAATAALAQTSIGS